MPEIETKVKNPTFATLFLDYNGLELFEKILDYLPDGSLPSSNLRKRVLLVLSTLPFETHNIENSNIQAVLKNLKESNLEMKDNIEIIKDILKKIANIECVHHINYKNLAREEEAYGGNILAKRQVRFEADNDDNVARARLKRKTYAFVVRPQSDISERKAGVKNDVRLLVGYQ